MKLFSKGPSKREKKIVYSFLIKVFKANEGVDIPYFLRPKEERYEYRAIKIIEQAIAKGTFKELYKKAIA